MISEAVGAGVIRQDVQQAIEREMRYRLGEGDASGALSRWQKAHATQLSGGALRLVRVPGDCTVCPPWCLVR